jgi:6-phosphogluconolactonase (cycloisomerase 2 family)
MKTGDIVLRSAVALVWLCVSAFASSEYVIVNSNNYVSNGAVLYKLNAKTGKLAKAGTLDTGGQASQHDDYFFQVQQAVSPEASCVFALDTGSSDVAAFSKSSGYTRAGRYFKAELIAGAGGSLALTPDAKFLYAYYETTSNIGLWSVNSDCTLTFVAAYGAATIAGPIKVNPQRQVSRTQRQGRGSTVRDQ